MSSDFYLSSIVKKYHINNPIDLNTQYYVIGPLEMEIKEWAGIYLNEIKLSGSRSKGTAITLSSDLDLFISLHSQTPNTLREIYTSLNKFLREKGYKTREQNVSIGVEIAGKKVDLVPAKKRPGNTNYHSIYKRKNDSWTQTNIEKHINLVQGSGRISEIILLKIWREINNLSFSSIYLELTVLNALKNKSKNALANNFWSILIYLRDEFLNKTVTDPSNTNNIISDDLYKYEKEEIRNKAIESLSKKYWNEILW